MEFLRKLNRKEYIRNLSIFLGICAIFFSYYITCINSTEYKLEYELINTKDMASVAVAEKSKTKSKNIFEIYKEMKNTGSNGTVQAVDLPKTNNSVANLPAPKRIWYLPTEQGSISGNVTYSHFALDITSPRGTSEAIYPVANGIISGIYRDYAGANIVTVNHNINGQNYTSQYVHLSSYAPNLYVGKEVTINDYLGFMGTTGNSTGVHLHVTLLDCSIFDPNDANCSNLGSFFRYGKRRYNEGFQGLQSVINVPTTWTSR